MGFGILLFGYLFLTDVQVAVNTEYNIGFDVLPDFIGYALLAVSMYFARDLSPHFENAWRKFRTLTLITLLKTLSLFWIFGGLTNAQERPTMMLLLSFCFVLCELIWGIPAWRSLIEGFVIHSQTAGGNFPLLEKGASRFLLP